MGMPNLDIPEAAKALADEAAVKLIPPLTDALAALPAALVAALDGMEITITIKRKAQP